MTENFGMDFLRKYIIDPLNNNIYGLRQVTKKIGYLEAIDGLFLRGIEEPLLWRLFTTQYGLEISDIEHLETFTSKGALFVANFQSVLDPIICGISIMHKMKKIPYHVLPMRLGVDSMMMNLVRINQAIFSRTADLEENAIEECIEHLEQHKWIILYPEMRPNRGNGNLLPFYPEYIRVAFESRVPIIPLAIFGTDRVFGPKMKIPAIKGKILLRFGKPLLPDSLFKESHELDYRLLEKINKKVKRKIKSLWTDLWAEVEDRKKENQSGSIN